MDSLIFRPLRIILLCFIYSIGCVGSLSLNYNNVQFYFFAKPNSLFDRQLCAKMVWKNQEPLPQIKVEST